MKIVKFLTQSILALVLCAMILPSDVAFAAKDNEKKEEDFVIMLDAGHDSTHAGAQNGGYAEEDLVYKITQYCKEELEKYKGVKVYITRDGYDCANGGAAVNSGDCNAKRVDYAASVGADLFVSFHINANPSSAPHGVGIYYPNNNYRPELGLEGLGVAQALLDRLKAIGFAQWSDGVLIRNSENNTLYPDGSLADYLGVIRRSKEAGITAVLIEHGFITNPSDVANFLSSDEKLKKIGVADAQALVDYYGFKQGKPKPGKATVAFDRINTVSGVFDVVVSNIQVSGEYDVIQVPVWSKDDQSDLVWYNAVLQPDGTYRAHVDVANHGAYFGEYKVHTYAKTRTGLMVQLNTTEIDMTAPKTKVTAALTEGGTVISGDAWHVPGTFGQSLTRVSFAIWSEKGGQDDLRWYDATQVADRFVINAPITNHMTTGKYYIHVYAHYSNGTSKLAGHVALDVPSASVGQIDVVNRNTVSGVFDVEISGATGMLGVQSVVVPVWSQKDQSDLVWYQATLGADGKYRIHMDVANHNCYFGTYRVHTYIRNGLGELIKVGETKVDMSSPKTTITVNMDEVCSSIQLDAWHVPGTFGASLQEVSFAVWSKNGGQDDLHWYTGTAVRDHFVVDLPMANHPDAGQYYVHVYMRQSNGAFVKVGELKFDRPLTEIMGTSQISVSDLVNYYNARATYPEYYASTDAVTLTDFCTIYVEEAAAEGVKVEVAFAQAMMETGYLKFGGDVAIGQHNFAGIGATGNGAAGHSFATVREGVRAQIQHLKAYASDQPLNQACVDPRFSYIKRNAAPYVEWLGINENPNGTGWAAADNYGYNLRDGYIFAIYGK